MPKTFLILIHQLNYEMFFLSEKGEEMGEQFREMNRMRITLIGGLQRKVIEEMKFISVDSNNKRIHRRTRSI